MLFLVMCQFFRVGKRNHDNRDFALLKLLVKSLQLAEMRLAGQSSEMAEKDQKDPAAKHRGEIHRLAL